MRDTNTHRRMNAEKTNICQPRREAVRQQCRRILPYLYLRVPVSFRPTPSMAAVHATRTVMMVVGTPSNLQSQHELSGPTDHTDHRGDRGGGKEAVEERPQFPWRCCHISQVNLHSAVGPFNTYCNFTTALFVNLDYRCDSVPLV